MRVLWKEGGKAKKNDIYLFQHDDDLRKKKGLSKDHFFRL